MRLRFSAFLLIVSVALGGCASSQRPQHSFQDSLASPYRLDSGDKLNVVVFGQTNLTKNYAVDGGGNMAFPLIGAVHARGLTVRQLEEKIGTALRRGFLRDPNVTVEVATYRPFFVLGEVRNPGQYPYVNGMTIQTAVAIAGGYTERANKRRAEISRQESGRIVSGKVATDFPVQPGDTVNIDERFF